MSLPIFDQIFTGLTYAFSVTYPILIACVIAFIVILIGSSWPTQFAAVLGASVLIFIAWAGYSTYGALGAAVLIIAFIFIVALFALFRR